LKKRVSIFRLGFLLGLGFSMDSGQHNLSTASSTPPLARASRSFSLFYKRGPTWPHHFTSLHALVLLRLHHFNATLYASLMFFLVLHCSCLCFTSAPPHVLLHCSSLCFLLLLMLCCSSCFTTPLTLLLFIVLHCSSSCFAPTPCASLLFLMFCCSYYFATMWCFVAPPHFVALLLS